LKTQEDFITIIITVIPVSHVSQSDCSQLNRKVMFSAVGFCSVITFVVACSYVS